MGEKLVASLLGEPRFALATSPVVCSSKKALGLFAYLLLTGRMHSRRDLAALLWGRGGEESARTSLRAALQRLPAAMEACLAVERDSIGIAVASAPVVDVARFEILARDERLERLEEAAALYGGDLLDRFEAGATAEFDDWLNRERTRVRQIAQAVFDGVIARRAQRAALDAARASAERESALATARRWTALMPGVEAAHRWLMQLYVDMGRRDSAIAQYELCQRELAVSHGRTPSQATRELYGIAQGGSPSGAPLDRARDANAVALDARVERYGVAATSFVGRIEELARLGELLADPQCRLVTLHGLGGAGKTRLAHALATQIGARFAQGVTWVALEATASSDALVSALAAALRRDLPSHGDRVGALCAMLAGQQRLLVLDNFETLLAGEAAAPDADPASVVLRILDAAPQVRIVATSREVLGLQEEWIFEVDGLAFTGVDAAAQASTPAVELFAQRARQAHLGFSLASELPHVLRICALVEGLPLGLELAAAWVRTIPCREIAAAIEREAAALATAHRNRPPRHQSLEAVVAYSWNLLDPDQQRTLSALGIFVGGFIREAAQDVADATLRMLSSLADKALVRRQSEGRYELHELVRQFALARLRDQPDIWRTVTDRYSDFFAALAVRTVDELRGVGEVAAAAALMKEFPNVLSAWRTALDARRDDVIEREAAPLISLLHYYGMLPMALAQAEGAVAMLGERVHADALADIRMQWGRAAVTGGEPEVARRELNAALATRASRHDLQIRCRYFLGTLEYQQGNIDAAERLGHETLERVDEKTDPELRGLVHNLLGTLANMRSRFDVAEHHLRLGLDAAREQQCPSRIGNMLCSLAVPLYYRGNFAEAAALTEEAATFFEMLGKHLTVAMIRSNLAAIVIAQGDLAAALVHTQSALRLARESGDSNLLSGVLATQGDIYLRQGALAAARGACAEGLRLAEATHHPLHITEALFLLASIDLAEGRRERALANILRLRDELAAHRLEVRVPMLVLATADWAWSEAGGACRPDARRWAAALSLSSEVDATLREKARALLAREDDASAAAGDAPAPSLSAMESEVLAFLARVGKTPTQ